MVARATSVASLTRTVTGRVRTAIISPKIRSLADRLKTDNKASEANCCKVRDLILERSVSAADRMNDRFSRHAAQNQQVPSGLFPVIRCAPPERRLVVACREKDRFCGSFRVSAESLTLLI